MEIKNVPEILTALERRVKVLEGKARSLASQIESQSIRINRVDEVYSDVCKLESKVREELSDAKVLNRYSRDVPRIKAELIELQAEVSLLKLENETPWYRRVFK